VSAFVAFLVFYGTCFVVTYGVNLRPATAGSRL
jgi:hypothetical protein